MAHEYLNWYFSKSRSQIQLLKINISKKLIYTLLIPTPIKLRKQIVCLDSIGDYKMKWLYLNLSVSPTWNFE